MARGKNHNRLTVAKIDNMSRPNLTIVIAQLNFSVGAVPANTQKILDAIQNASRQEADVVIFPELALSGYPPEDLVFSADFHRTIQDALARIQQASHDLLVIVGHPWLEGDECYNGASVFHQQRLTQRYCKQQLPNYGVFDEQRYFTTGTQSAIIDYKCYRLGLLICEDAWFAQPAQQLKAAGAELIMHINASPFNLGKHQQRLAVIRERVHNIQLPWVYAHQVGGQDEVVFDGGSFVMTAQGGVTHQAQFFAEQLLAVTFQEQAQHLVPCDSVLLPEPASETLLYQALVLAVQDYVNKNGFPGVIIGLSGGIDSALTLAIAVDALGAERVRAVLMPSRYTAEISNADAIEQAKRLNCRYEVISIEPMFQTFLKELPVLFAEPAQGLTEENLQARCRGVVLMALSNQTGWLVLTTSNKSELAVGYSTLYGDMAGGFCVLKDVLKTQVYALAQYRNTLAVVIPERVISRAPSAELRPNQTDQDSLPAYAILDRIIELHVAEYLGLDEMVARGLDHSTVVRVLRMIQRAEYKRRQAPPGPKLSTRAFGKDWRYPITSGWSIGLTYEK